MNRVREARIEKGLSITELARRSGVSRVTISQIENDKKPVTTSRTISAISKALEKPVELLFFDN